MTVDSERLAALAEFLDDDLAYEVRRLQELEQQHQALVDEHAETSRQLHTATVMVGELRQRAVRAETRLEDLGADAIVKARAAAHLHGDGFVRVTAQGRGRYTAAHVPTDQVVLRLERSTP